MQGQWALYSALFIYFGLLTFVVVWSSKQVKSNADFIIGNRSLNFWLTAMAAHASDMSSWLFMGYPALIFVGGLFHAWVAVGLIVCMWINWQLVATRLRVQTGKWKCSTFSSFLHHRYEDNSGILQLFSAVFCFFFYVVYLCAGLTGLGILGQTLFGLDYSTCLVIGAFVVTSYVMLGGYITLAWIDLVQGIFLLLVLCAVPIMLAERHGGWSEILSPLVQHASHLKFLPSSFFDIFSILTMIFGWGLGYFGQPHIITKFMGIEDPKQLKNSRNVCMAWMTVSLAAATVVGLLGYSLFPLGLPDAQLVFVESVKGIFSPFLLGLILCAILAATINVMSSQLLVVSSVLTEDVLKRFVSKKMSTQWQLLASRACIVVTSLFAFFIANQRFGSIYDLVHYAWSGLGASFGPLVLLALYSKKGNVNGAIAAIVMGGLTAAVWPTLNGWLLPVQVDSLIPGFVLSFAAFVLVSALTQTKHSAKYASS
jgi:sodium/proline symporter